MFCRIVQIDGKEIIVACTPQTPLSEVLRMAAKLQAKNEQRAREKEMAS
jgi:hypothetical protein